MATTHMTFNYTLGKCTGTASKGRKTLRRPALGRLVITAAERRMRLLEMISNGKRGQRS